jgi:hypothetical protein
METTTTHITISLTREVAVALCERAGILAYENPGHDAPELMGVPVGVWYDTENCRWTWSLDEATRWATVMLAEEA